jgi:hypothetical protein
LCCCLLLSVKGSGREHDEGQRLKEAEGSRKAAWAWVVTRRL